MGWGKKKNVTLFNRRCIEPVLTCELQRHRGGSTLRENHDDQVDSHVIDMMHYTEGNNDYDIEAWLGGIDRLDSTRLDCISVKMHPDGDAPSCNDFFFAAFCFDCIVVEQVKPSINRCLKNVSTETRREDGSNQSVLHNFQRWFFCLSCISVSVNSIYDCLLWLIKVVNWIETSCKLILTRILLVWLKQIKEQESNTIFQDSPAFLDVFICFPAPYWPISTNTSFGPA